MSLATLVKLVNKMFFQYEENINIITISTVYAHTYKGGETPFLVMSPRDNMFHKYEIQYKSNLVEDPLCSLERQITFCPSLQGLIVIN